MAITVYNILYDVDDSNTYRFEAYNGENELIGQTDVQGSGEQFTLSTETVPDQDIFSWNGSDIVIPNDTEITQVPTYVTCRVEVDSEFYNIGTVRFFETIFIEEDEGLRIKEFDLVLRPYFKGTIS